MTGESRPGCDLLRGETEQRGRPLRELGVGLVEDGPLVVLGGRPAGFHHGFPGLGDVLEISRFAGEALAVLRVFLVFAPPEIGRVGDVGIGGVDDRQALLGRADDEGRPAGRGGVFQRIAGLALGGVHADGHGVARHPRADQAHRHHHRLGAGLAGELHVGGLDVRRGPDGFGHDRARWA